MNDFRADLHCHTTCSDGSETPEQVIDIAKAAGLSALSITDHDTVEAYATATPLAKNAGITLLTGVEFSSHLQEHSVHILGYGFSPEDPHIAALCAWHTQRRKDRNMAILKQLAKQGMSIDYEDLAAAIPADTKSLRTIGRPHIAFAMVHKGYVNSLQEAFNKFIGEGRPCFIQGATYSVDDTIDAIHKAKGVAVIAHPHLIKDNNLLHTLLTKPFDGIECYYGKFLADNHQRWLKIAAKKKLLVTGGSDFHGRAKPNLPLGCSWIDQERFKAINDRLAEISGS